MKSILFILFISTFGFASIDNINSFEADFKQVITDEKNKKLIYKGHVIASRPQNVLWNYVKPIKKKIYIQNFGVTIVEPEMEQIIKKKYSSAFNFFKMLEKAKKIDKNTYLVINQKIKFFILMQNNIIKSISYKDKFENNVEIIFDNQKQNKKIDKNIFYLSIPDGYDVVVD